MKKIFLLSLSAALLFVLSGCFGNGNEDNSGSLNFEYEVIDFVRLKDFSPNADSNVAVTTSVLEYENFLDYIKFYMSSESNTSSAVSNIIDPENNKYKSDFFSEHDLVFIYTEDERPSLNTVTDVKYLSESGELSIEIAKTVSQKPSDGTKYSLILVSVPKTGCSSSSFNVTKFVQTSAASKKEIYTNISVVTKLTDGAVYTASHLADGSSENFIFSARPEEDLKVGDRIISVSNAVYSDGKNQFFIDPLYFEKYTEDIDDLRFSSFLYFYPEEEKTSLKISVSMDGMMSKAFPSYENGWILSASSDGTFTDRSGETFDYLSWTGFLDKAYDLSCGYCIKGDEIQTFFTEKAKEFGLSEKESKDFVSYWTEKLKDNKYNFIAFSINSYAQTIKYEFSKEPDTIIRLFTVAVPLENYLEVEPQQFTLSAVQKTGFTVTEWSGVVLPHEVLSVKN